MTEKKKVIIIDGDDTLWRTQELYDSAKRKFNILMRNNKLSNGEILELFDWIDATRVKIAKFSKSRFFESMLITYGILCGKNNKEYDIHIESKIKELGFVIFNIPVLFDETIPSLETLSKHFILILFTNGDKDIQENKINSLGEKFRSFFFKIYISEMKNEQELKKIIKDLKVPRDKVWVVGNSVKSDINPALKLGIKPILIPQGIWKYEESELYNNKLQIVNSLKEAVNILTSNK